MTEVLKSLKYGTKQIQYHIFYTDRKTLEIAVHPDGEVLVKAPKGSEFPVIEKKLLKRARWILKQIDYFKQFAPKTPERRFISGESHLYLGKKYRLKVFKGETDRVKLTKGKFLIELKNDTTPETAKKMLNQWYLEKAKTHFLQSLNRCWPKFSLQQIEQPSLSIRRMKTRWGSLSENGVITLNTNLIQAPKECLDYVITHELCHLRYNNHDADFYALLASIMPNWKKVKHKLELSLA